MSHETAETIFLVAAAVLMTAVAALIITVIWAAWS